MRPAVLADTGPLYGAVDPDDSYHNQSQQEPQRLSRERRDVVLAFPTLLEAYTLVLYRLGPATAQAWLSSIMAGAALINPTPDDYHEAVRIIQTFADQQISLFDALVAVMATRLKVQVWTYDHHFDVTRVEVWR